MNAREATLAAALLLTLGAARASAQTYTVPWWTVDAGGHNGATAGSSYSFDTTAGQPDAGGPFASATFTLHSGYWSLFASGGGGPQADLAVTLTDGQTTAVPGTPITYHMTVSNLGPHAANGAWLNGTSSLAGVTWTCTATPGSSCPASGAGHLNHFADVGISGTLAYTLTGTVHSNSSGTLTESLLATVPSGTTDPDPSNNGATDVDVLTPHADLAVALSESHDPVGPGMDFAYFAEVTNAGPSASGGSTLTVALPVGVTFQASGSMCTHAGGIVTCDLPFLEVGAVETRPVLLWAPGTPGPIAGIAATAGDDPDPVGSNNSATEITTIAARARAALTHGARIEANLQGFPYAANPDFYAIRQEPHASYEVVIDGTSGDLADIGGVELRLFDADGTTSVAGGAAIGVGPSRSMRWINSTTSVVDDQVVRVRSQSCTYNCGPDDVYRIRAWETTAFIPRFNNSGSQVTVVLVQNTSAAPAEVRLHFWSAAGALLFEQMQVLPPKGLLSLNTSGIAELQGATGSITVASSAPYGTLAGKAVALEPSTGLCFDSPLTPKPR